MADFTPINTQEEFDNAIKDRLARERQKFDDYDSLKQQVADLTKGKGDFEKTLADKQKELDAALASVKERDTKIKGYEVDALRTKVAIESGLPVELREYLKGETEEALKESAAALKKFTSRNPAPKADPEGDPPSKNSDAELKKLYHQLRGGNQT